MKVMVRLIGVLLLPECDLDVDVLRDWEGGRFTGSQLVLTGSPEDELCVRYRRGLFLMKVVD